MRVAPRPDPRIETEVLVAHVDPADEGDLAIDDDGLAVVAELDLEAMALRAAAEACDLAARFAKRREVAAREIRRSELVVEKPHRAAASPCRDQRVAQPPPDAVVAHDVELDEHVSLCLRDRREDRVEGRLAVDEEPRRVAAGRRQRRQPADRRAEARRLAIDGRLAARLARWRSTDREGLDRVVGLRPQRSQRLLPAAQRLHVAVEAAVAEDEIERDRRDG